MGVEAEHGCVPGYCFQTWFFCVVSCASVAALEPHPHLHATAHWKLMCVACKAEVVVEQRNHQ